MTFILFPVICCLYPYTDGKDGNGLKLEEVLIPSHQKDPETYYGLLDF